MTARPSAKQIRDTFDQPTLWQQAALRDRVQSRVVIDDGGCWIWQGQHSQKGYGQVGAYGRTRRAHRVAYELFVGPIPEGLEIDHLCRVRDCVNPAHLEAVTHAENVRRGTVGLYLSQRTHCKNGHEFTPENTKYEARRGNTRLCCACEIERHRRSNAALAKRRALRAALAIRAIKPERKAA